jgi:hypothetical protein
MALNVIPQTVFIKLEDPMSPSDRQTDRQTDPKPVTLELNRE